MGCRSYLNLSSKPLLPSADAMLRSGVCVIPNKGTQMRNQMHLINVFWRSLEVQGSHTPGVPQECVPLRNPRLGAPNPDHGAVLVSWGQHAE